MNGLDLFSGIGGITKALEGYVQPVAYCENDRYAIAVLLSRMRAGDLPSAPIWTDVQTLRACELPDIDIIYGGFPCQDISCAGRGEGLGGERSGLFFEIIRLASEIRPRFVFLENVSAITVRGSERVVGEFCRLGYDCRWGILSAQDVGANHRRDRWWLLAHTEPTERRPGDPEGRAVVRESGVSQRKEDAGGLGICGEEVANANAVRRNGRTGMLWPGRRRESADGSWWLTEPNVGRVAHGIPLRVDRLRALGNAVVPAQAREAFERLMGI